MSATADWRGALTASERFENCSKIEAYLQSGKPNETRSAYEIENEAYCSSESRDEYEQACENTLRQHEDVSAAHEQTLVDVDELGTERVGHYRNCRYIASGVTSNVFKSGDKALKVITETQKIAPHDPHREAKILKLLKRPCIPLLEVFRDHEQRFTLVFPYMPLDLATLLEQQPLREHQVVVIMMDLLQALSDIHARGIIHRDVKPSAVLLAGPDGPAFLSDFGIAWHPSLSAPTEPKDNKILDVGTGPYRAPECLFGDRSYGSGIDMWATGAMLVECLRNSPASLFESRAAHEDGNQLGLILSIFKTIGSPTPESWPEALNFRTPPFQMYRSFEGRTWKDILPDVETPWIDLVQGLVKYSPTYRLNAGQALQQMKMRERP